MSPTRRATMKRSGVPEPAAARARIQRSASYRWWRTVPMYFFGSRMADYATSEVALAKTVLANLGKGMLCLADRGFFGFEMWKQAAATGAGLLWRLKKNMRLPRETRLPAGSYLSRIYVSEKDQRQGTNGVTVRAIDYRLEGVEGAEPLYRLATTILDHKLAPAAELAAIYHERWEIETAFDELKTHLRGAR